MQRASWVEKDRYHATDACVGAEAAQRREVHARREADDLCHKWHGLAIAGRRDTMKRCSFQGAA